MTDLKELSKDEFLKLISGETHSDSGLLEVTEYQDEIRRRLALVDNLLEDSARIEFLEQYAKEHPYGNGIILRESTTGRGWRLHSSTREDFGECSDTVRKAIDKKREKGE